MGLILNIETATKVCSVSLAKDAELLKLKEYTDDAYSHARLLTVFIEDIFKESEYKITDLDAVAVSKGPGSYTGLRIGVSAAKGIAYGAEIPLISVSTLQAMALGMNDNIEDYSDINLSENLLFCPMIDARRMEVYTSFFDKNNSEIRTIQADIIDKNSYCEYLSDNKVLFFGDGAAKCKNTVVHNNAVFVDSFNPSSRFMIKLSEKAYINKEFKDIAYFEPFYLKDFIATVPKKNIYG